MRFSSPNAARTLCDALAAEDKDWEDMSHGERCAWWMRYAKRQLIAGDHKAACASLRFATMAANDMAEERK